MSTGCDKNFTFFRTNSIKNWLENEKSSIFSRENINMVAIKTVQSSMGIRCCLVQYMVVSSSGCLGSSTTVLCLIPRIFNKVKKMRGGR